MQNCLVALSRCLLLVECVICFTYHVTDGRIMNRRLNTDWFPLSKSSKASTTPTALPALVFYPDDGGCERIDNDIVNPYAHEEYMTATATRQDNYYLYEHAAEHVDLKGRLEFPRDALARLAVAFAPPGIGDGMRLEKISNIEVLSVDESHIDINAILCDRQECVAVEVPVNFPHPCSVQDSEEGLTSCVIDNIGSLDVEADMLLQQKDLSRLNAEGQASGVGLQPLTMDDPTNVNLPSWWVHPLPNSELAEECDSILRLLNEESFRSDVSSVAATALVDQHYDPCEHVNDALVVKVGPAGICLRVRTTVLQHHDLHVHVMDVAVAFDEHATNAEQLRASVLDLVETATTAS